MPEIYVLRNQKETLKNFFSWDKNYMELQLHKVNRKDIVLEKSQQDHGETPVGRWAGQSKTVMTLR